jgi:hypothetical protein
MLPTEDAILKVGALLSTQISDNQATKPVLDAARTNLLEW